MSTYSPVEAFMPVPAGSDETLLRYHAALETGVDRDLLQRRGERHLHDVRATGLVTRQVSFSKAVPTAFTSATPPPGARRPRSRLSAAGDEGQTRVGGQVRELEVPATKTTRKYYRDARRTTDLLPGQHRTGSRQEPPGARFGGIPLTGQRTATLTDLNPSWPAANATS
jgi:hypothetical protein